MWRPCQLPQRWHCEWFSDLRVNELVASLNHSPLSSGALESEISTAKAGRQRGQKQGWCLGGGGGIWLGVGGGGFGGRKGEESVIDRPPRSAPCRPLIRQRGQGRQCAARGSSWLCPPRRDNPGRISPGPPAEPCDSATKSPYTRQPAAQPYWPGKQRQQTRPSALIKALTACEALPDK